MNQMKLGPIELKFALIRCVFQNALRLSYILLSTAFHHAFCCAALVALSLLMCDIDKFSEYRTAFVSFFWLVKVTFLIAPLIKCAIMLQTETVVVYYITDAENQKIPFSAIWKI